MDEELMAAINEQADRAEEAKPNMIDAMALSIELSKRFGKHSPKEIEEKIKDVWRMRGLFWLQ